MPHNYNLRSGTPVSPRKRLREVSDSGVRHVRQTTSTPTPLTAQNLAAFNRQTMTKRSFDEMKQGSSKASTRTTDSKFELKLYNNGIHKPKYPPKHKPEDLEDIEAYLNRDRDSPSPTSEEFRNFCGRTLEAPNEATYAQFAFNMLTKPRTYDDEQPYTSIANQEWANVTDMDITKGLSNPKPDRCDAHSLKNFPSHAIEALGSNLQPSSHGFAMPKTTIELKGPDGSHTNGQLQSAYNGAVMTSAAMRTNTYMGKPAGYRTTQALTMTAGKISAEVHTHSAHLDKGQEVYDMNPVCTMNPLASFNGFKSARKQTRNFEDWGLERSEAMLEELRSFNPTQASLPPHESLHSLETSLQEQTQNSSGKNLRSTRTASKKKSHHEEDEVTPFGRS